MYKTHAEVVARMQAIRGEMEALKGQDGLNGQERETRLQELLEEFRGLNARRIDMEHDAALAEVREAGLAGHVEHPVGTPAPVERSAGDDNDDDSAVRGGDRRFSARSAAVSRRQFRNPWDISGVRTFDRDPEMVADELRSRALDAVERMSHAGDRVREVSARFVGEEIDPNSVNAKLLLATSSPTYVRAFSKLLKARGNLAALNAEESATLARAMSTTNTAGGYLIPFQLDPTVILTTDGSRNRLRQISRVVTATGNKWNGVSSAGVTGSWDAEAAEVSDDAPALAQPTVDIPKGQIFVPISIEAEQDEQNVASEVARMIAFEKDRMESVAFVTGTGTGEPRGIVTALTGTPQLITSVTTDTFAVADVYALDGALPARYADGATWLAHRSIYNLIRRFDTQGGASLWTTLGNGLPPDLLGRPNVTAEAMDGVVNATQENYVLIFGDFQNYVIADRIGTTVEYVPTLFGANRRPTGQRGWHAWFRTGANSVNNAAFRMLNVT